MSGPGLRRIGSSNARHANRSQRSFLAPTFAALVQFLVREVRLGETFSFPLSVVCKRLGGRQRGRFGTSFENEDRNSYDCQDTEDREDDDDTFDGTRSTAYMELPGRRGKCSILGEATAGRLRWRWSHSRRTAGDRQVLRGVARERNRLA